MKHKFETQSSKQNYKKRILTRHNNLKVQALFKKIIIKLKSLFFKQYKTELNSKPPQISTETHPNLNNNACDQFHLKPSSKDRKT